MKSILSTILLAVSLSTFCYAQKPSSFVPDVLQGVVKLNMKDVQKTEAFSNAGAGVLYQFLKFDGTTKQWGYDVAVGGHIFIGYFQERWHASLCAGPSFFNGWLRIEPGWDFESQSGVIMVGTSYGFSLPDLDL